MEQKTSNAIHSAKTNFGKKGWAVIIFTFVIYLVTAQALDSLNVSVTAFSSAFGWDSNTMLSFAGIGGFLGIVIAVIFGQVIQKTNVKTPTVIGMFILAALWFFNGQATTLVMYGIALILIIAFSNTVNLISTQQIMSNYFPKKKGLALGFATMGMNISSAFIVPVFQILLGVSISAPFITMSGVMIVLALVAIFWFKSYPEQMGAYPDNEPTAEIDKDKNIAAISEYKSSFTVGKLFKTGQFWLISLIFGLLFMGLIATMIQMVPRLMSIGFSIEEGILWLTVASVVGIPASYLWGLLDQKIGTKKAVNFHCVHWVIAALLSVAGQSTGDAALSMVSVVIFACALGGLSNLMPSMIIQVFGRYDFAAANKVVVPVVIGLRTAMLLIIPVILASTGADAMLGWRNVFILVTILCVIALILSFFLSNKTIGKVDINE